MMRTYQYRAVSREGVRRSGTIQAISEIDASRKLRAEGLAALGIRQARQRSAVFSFQRVTHADIVELTQQLAVLVESRLPLAKGIASIAEHQRKPATREMLESIATSIEAGSSISEAFEPHRRVLGDVYVETLSAAQRSGNLSEVLEHLAEMLERQAETRRELRRALSYPAIVMVVVAIALSVIVVFVVPRFGATFASQGMEMPIVTRMIQSLGSHLRQGWWAYLSLVVGMVAGGTLLWRSTTGRALYERAFLWLPFVRRIVLAVTAARFARVLGIGVGSGLDVIESLEMAGRATGRPLFERETQRMAEGLRRGESMADVLRASQYVPSFAQRMLTTSEDAKGMTRACNIVSKQYDRESGHLTGQIGTLIEPALTLVLAAIVLLVALSVFLPMWQMVRVNQ